MCQHKKRTASQRCVLLTNYRPAELPCPEEPPERQEDHEVVLVVSRARGLRSSAQLIRSAVKRKGTRL